MRDPSESDSFPHCFSEVCKIRVSKKWGEEIESKAWREMPEKHRNLQVGEQSQQMRKCKG